MNIEVEVKALVGNKDEAQKLRDRLLELGAELKDKQTQKNFYYFFPNKATLTNLESYIPQFASIRVYGTDEYSISLRLRKINENPCLLVAKIDMRGNNPANGLSRIEIEEELDYDSIEDLDLLLQENGCEVQSKWSRIREVYEYEDTCISIDFNAGYGYVCEVEQSVTDKAKQEVAEKRVHAVLETLNLSPLPGDRLERMFEYYNENWQDYYGTNKVFNIE